MFQIDPLNRTPVYEQLIRQTERLVLTGIFRPLEQVPSVRALSMELSVNPNTIQKSYLELARRGVLQSAQGSGYYVADDALNTLREARSKRLADVAKLTKELASAGISLEMIENTVREAFADHK